MLSHDLIFFNEEDAHCACVFVVFLFHLFFSPRSPHPFIFIFFVSTFDFPNNRMFELSHPGLIFFSPPLFFKVSLLVVSLRMEKGGD